MIYLDNAATTKMYDEAARAMAPFYSESYANPSGIYGFASESRKAINDARKVIAGVINAEPSEIYFTSGGTESDNWAVSGAVRLARGKGCHIITTGIEHHAVLNVCKFYESMGVGATYVSPAENGIIDPEDIENAIRPDTALISVMTANNEIGTIQPVREIGDIAKRHGILFHTDAVAAFGHMPIDVKEMRVDMLSASAHKCHGPKGAGFLYIKDGIKMLGFHLGGRQERTRRAGTENVAGIAGFAAAARIADERMEYNNRYIKGLRDHFISRVLNEIEDARLNGDALNRLCGNANFSFGRLDGEAVAIRLDIDDICCSAGSACDSGTNKPSHVIKSIYPEGGRYAGGAVRFTLSEFNTASEIDFAADVLRDAVPRLREMVPARQPFFE